jgi:hypothetical protein
MLFMVCTSRAAWGFFHGMKAFAAEDDDPPPYFERFSKEEKVLFLNAGVFAAALRKDREKKADCCLNPWWLQCILQINVV